jgi:hypothetical protein
MINKTVSEVNLLGTEVRHKYDIIIVTNYNVCSREFFYIKLCPTLDG